MYHLGQCIGISKHVEVLIEILIGIGCAIVDPSLFNLNSNLKEVWDVSLDPYQYPLMIQLYLKYIMSGVILVRTCTLHIYLALYIVMLWPAVFEDRPSLLLPWLVIGFIRSLLVNVIALSTGLYLCFTHEGVKLLCVDYALSQVIDHGPSVYVWFLVLSYYKDLKATILCQLKRRAHFLEQLALRRKKARTLSIEYMNFDEKADDGRNLISESTIDSLCHYLNTKLTVSRSRSLDSLLSLNEAEEEQEEIMNIYYDITDDENTKSTTERAMKLLNVVKEDVSRAKKEKGERTLRILSDITLDALSYMGDRRIISTVSSASFFVKNGQNYISKLKSKRLKSLIKQNIISEDDLTEENDQKILGQNMNANEILESTTNEMELVNMFLESKFPLKERSRLKETAEKLFCGSPTIKFNFDRKKFRQAEKPKLTRKRNEMKKITKVEQSAQTMIRSNKAFSPYANISKNPAHKCKKDFSSNVHVKSFSLKETKDQIKTKKISKKTFACSSNVNNSIKCNKISYVDFKEDKTNKKTETSSDFECQVSTLSRSILNNLQGE